MASEKLEERKNALKLIERADWLPASILDSKTQKTVRINVGGLMFEVNENVLQRDPASVLCKLTSEDPPHLPEEDGSFVFQRDWWLFRFILSFLRDGTLPDDRGLLAQLYKETAYWHLTEMQCAIEEQKLHLRKAPKKDSEGQLDEKAAKEESDKWWRKQPSWWRAVSEAEKSMADKERAAAAKGKDWWTSDKYKGMTFTAGDKKKVKGVAMPTEGTWTTGRSDEDMFGNGYGNFDVNKSGGGLPDPYNFVVGKGR